MVTNVILFLFYRPILTRELSSQTLSPPTTFSLMLVEILNGVVKDLKHRLLGTIQMQIILVTIQPMGFQILVELYPALDKLSHQEEEGEAQAPPQLITQAQYRSIHFC